MGGWFFLLLLFNFVSLFFIVGVLHFLKGFFYSSYRLKGISVFGLGILILLMLVSFLGYVMVWSRVSFWASILITSLLGVMPIFWGNFILFFLGVCVFSSNSLKVFFVVMYLYFLYFLVDLQDYFFFLGVFLES